MNDEFNNKAGDENLLDDLFRQTLGGQRIEPSAGLWKGISRKLLWRELTRFNFTNLPRAFWAAGGAALVIISGAVYLTLRAPESDLTGQAAKPEGMALATMAPVPAARETAMVTTAPAVATTSPSTKPSGAVSPAVAAGTKYPAGSPGKRTTGGKTALAGTEDQTLENKLSEPDPGMVLPTSSMPAGPVAGTGAASLSDRNAAATSVTSLLPISVSCLDPVEGADTLIITTPTDIILVNRKAAAPPNGFSLALGIAPEAAFYKTTSAYTEWNYWMNLGIACNISRFSVRTGVGLGYVFDDGIYRIDYKSKDVVGYFYEVVSYSVNPVNPADITFHTVKSNVYDSITHIADDRTRDRYTYLQVPLLVGYRVLETSRLGLTLQAGPAVSFLVAEKKALPVIDYPNARIIRVEDDTPERVGINWQVWLNLSLEYRLNRQLSLYAEPYYRYYFNPVVKGENLEAGNPSAFGLGLGIQYHFGSKSTKK